MGYIELKTGQVALRGKAKPIQPSGGWKALSLPFSANAITFGDGKFVIVGEDSKFAYSTDGITWTTTAAFNNAKSPFSAVTYGNGKFVAIAESDYDSSLGREISRTAYSTDAINWTLGEMPFNSDWRSVTYGNDKFVAVCRMQGTSDAAYSIDGINWTEMTIGVSSDQLGAVAYGNGKFVTFGHMGGGNDDRTGYYSTDGINWNTMTLPYLPISKEYTDITFGNGKFVAMTTEQFYCVYSTDGINWTKITMPSSQQWHAVTYGNDKFVAVADAKADVCAYSTDGITWTEMSMPKKGYWRDVVYGNDKFVAISPVSAGGYSTDAAYWYGNV